MKSLTAILASAILLSQATAFAMPSTLDMSCRQVASLVSSKGAVVLSTGPGLFDRYVNGQVYCGEGLIAMPAWIPTKDSAQCYVGYTCTVPSPGTGG